MTYYENSEQDFDRALAKAQEMWSDLTEDEKALEWEFLSDFYKDVYGVRPRNLKRIWGLN